MILTVNTLDFRQALQSVIPHAAPPKDYPAYAVVHFTATDQNLYLTACNVQTLGHAVASVWEAEGLTGDPDHDAFNLPIDVAKELLALFKSSGKRKEDEIGEALRLTIKTKSITVLDMSGLFPGKELTIPREDGNEYPLPFGRMLMSALLSDHVMPERVTTQGRLIKLFSTAAAAYGEPLAIEPTEDARRILISCGESFLGLLMPLREAEMSGDLDKWRDGWMRRLPEIAHAGGGKKTEEQTERPANVTATLHHGGNVQDITDAVFNRVVEIVEPHL